MARKNTLFDVDITKENPLITIINHGKIPVIDMQDVQFRRYKVDSIFIDSKNWLKKCKQNNICYVSSCNIGGFHGVDFSHWMIMENINIGYIEPDTLVFDNTSNAVVTAKRKLQSVKKAWDSLLKKEDENDIAYGKWSWFNEHFANFQSVWVDNKAIKKVWTIPTTNFKSYLPYMKDGYLGIGCVNDLFHSLWNEKLFDKEYLEHIDAPNFYEEWNKKVDRDCSDSHYYVNYEFNHDFMEHNSEYQRRVFEELLNHYTGKPYFYTRKYFQKYKSASVKFHDYLKGWSSKDGNVTRGYNYGLNDWLFSENYLNTYFHYQESIQIQFWDGKLYIRKNDYSYHSIDLSTDEIFQNKYRYCMYEFLKLFDTFYEMFKELYKIEYPSILRQVEKYKKLEDLLKQNMCQYEANDIDNIIVILEKDFQIEYNLILKDVVIIIPDEERRYYNIDNIPIEYKSKRMADIISILLQEDSANGNR